MQFSTNELTNSLFIDIETVSGYKDVDTFKSSAPALYEIWYRNTMKDLKIDPGTAHLYNDDILDQYKEAGLQPEFGKIVTIAFGILTDLGDKKLKVNYSVISDRDESLLLKKALRIFNKYSKHYLAGHNIKGFDIPYLGKRMLINKFELPYILDVSRVKTWNMKVLDTMELWQFAGKNRYVSLELLCEVLGVKTSKDAVKSSSVGEEYWQNDNLEGIAKYCSEDVRAVIDIAIAHSEGTLVD